MVGRLFAERNDLHEVLIVLAQKHAACGASLWERRVGQTVRFKSSPSKSRLITLDPVGNVFSDSGFDPQELMVAGVARIACR